MKLEGDKPMNISLVNNPNEKRLLQTADGSWTLHIPEVEETYHSRHGAAQESMHVFIDNGLKHCSNEHIKILEVGLGTGLNVILSLLNAHNAIEYQGIEPYPIDKKLVEDLISTSEGYAQLYQYIHFSTTDEPIPLGNDFTLIKHQLKFLDFKCSVGFDIIYYDAFGPRVEPSLWTLEAMQKCYDLLNPGGIWVSYCAKGEVRRNLIAVGFQVERLPGPPGKREMLRAKK